MFALTPLEIEALSLSLRVGVVSVVFSLPFGLACAFHEGLNWSKLKLLSTKQILEPPEA